MERKDNSVKSWEFMRKNICYDNVEFAGMRNYYDEIGRGRNSEEILVRKRDSKGGEKTVVFYIGNRKQIFEITEEVKAVYAILEEIEANETYEEVLCIIDGIKKGRSDVAIMQDVHWQKNAYYERKDRLIDKIFECCIYRRLVEYEEIMGRNIA